MTRLVNFPDALLEQHLRQVVVDIRARQRRKDRRRRLVLLVLIGLVLFVLLPGIAAWAIGGGR